MPDDAHTPSLSPDGGEGRGEGKALLLLALGVLLGLAARLAFAFTDDGLLWPDEYYQSLEPAHRAVFGYGWQAWEFLEGARHWTLPGFVALLMRIAETIGVDYLTLIENVFCLVGAATALAVYSLARAQGASRLSSATVASVLSLMGFAVYVAPRAMGETLSALPVALAFVFLLRARPGLSEPVEDGRSKPSLRLGDVFAAGALLSFAVGLRLQNGLFCLFALGMLLFARQRRAAVQLLAVLTLGALLYGAVDWLTWGRPFHSALTYLRFNLVEGRSSEFGTEPFFFYVQALLTAEGLTLVPLLALSVFGLKTRRELPLLALGFVFVHSFIGHKELRFIFPALPLLSAHAALGLDRLTEPRLRRAIPVLLACAVASLLTLPSLTYGRLGISEPPSSQSAIDFGGPENRLLRRARSLEDLCGLQIASIAWWRTGGYAYLHRPVPMYGPRPAEGHFNYVIARRGERTGTEVARDGDVVLLKTSDTCTPDPEWNWHLE